MNRNRRDLTRRFLPKFFLLPYGTLPKSEDLKYFILKYKLLLVVSFAGDYTNSIVFDKIYNSVTVIINSSAPKTT